jgi:hypothetical protein
MCKTNIIYYNLSTIFTYIFGKKENKKGLNTNIVLVVCTKIKETLGFSKISQIVLIICKYIHLIPRLTFR